METPDYEKFTKLEHVEEAIAVCKDNICRKLKNQLQIKDAKKEAATAYNEQIKEIQEEIDFEMGVLDGFTSRLKVLLAGK